METIEAFKTFPLLKQERFNHHFVPYVWVKNFLTKEEIFKIQSLWDSEKAQAGRINNGNTPVLQIRKSKTQFIAFKGNDWIYNKLATICSMVNAAKYQFDILGFESKLQLTQYDKDDFYHWHADSGKGRTSMRKLSITVQLSEAHEYEGGELQFLNAKDYENAPKDRGTAIIFPSYTAHRVMPVISGCRQSIVGWIAGPPYR